MAELATFLELLKLYGIPLVMLAAVSIASWKLLAKKDKIIEAKDDELKTQDGKHEAAMLAKSEAYAKVLSEKEAEIKRLNDARLDDSLKHGERMLAASKESTELVAETNTTLNVLTEHIKAWRQAVNP